MRTLTAVLALGIVAALLVGVALVLGYVDAANTRIAQFDQLAQQIQKLRELVERIQQERGNLDNELRRLQQDNDILNLRIEGLIFAKVIVKNEIGESPQFALYVNDEKLGFARLFAPRRIILQLYQWGAEQNQYLPIGKRVDLSAVFALKPGMLVAVRKLAPEELTQGEVAEPYLLDPETGLWVEVE